MTNGDTSRIHRHLDDTFETVSMTPELRDLKEELRAGLSARVDELMTEGKSAQAAADHAIVEFGDLDALIAQVSGDSDHQDVIMDAFRLNRIRPRPVFVVRTVMLATVLAAAIVLGILNVVGPLSWPAAALLMLALAAVAVPSGIITADALRQETSQNYRLPRLRAVLYGSAAATGVAGVSFIGLGVAVINSAAVITAGVVFVVIAAGGLAGLGASQTNRSKAWTHQIRFADDAQDAFSSDPTAAARFGIYTLAIWAVAISVFIAASLTAGFRWSWLSLIAGLVVFMIVLARMQFPPNRTGGRTNSDT